MLEPTPVQWEDVVDKSYKKHLKKLKREHKKLERRKREVNKPKNLYWPSVYCTKEKMFIAFSKFALRLGGTRYSIDPKHWSPEYRVFRSDEYKINFADFEKNTLVKCPKCGGFIDFRLWVSSKIPAFYEVKHD